MRNLVFIGQKRYFFDASFHGISRGWSSNFIDLDSTQSNLEVLEILGRYQPSIIVMFRPERVAVLSQLIKGKFNCVVIGYLSEPIARRFLPTQDNLRSRRNYLLRELHNCYVDYWICYSKELADELNSRIDVWSCMLMPVNDDLFVESLTKLVRRQPIFVGRLNPYRQNFINEIKQAHDPIVIENGVSLRSVNKLWNSDRFIGINIHVGKIANFEHRVYIHMALGHLVFSQMLPMESGLLPDCEYVQFDSPSELDSKLTEFNTNLARGELIAKRGNLMVQRFKASVIWTNVCNSIIKQSISKK